jgi:hypothetical protein
MYKNASETEVTYDLELALTWRAWKKIFVDIRMIMFVTGCLYR